MNEKTKFNESNYFYSRMLEEQNSKDNFKNNLSAFLSSSRSILQYALEEAKKIKGGQQWFDDWAKRPLLAFFRDKRDLNIHVKPILPAANYKVGLAEKTGSLDSVEPIQRDKNGRIINQHSSE